MGKSWIIEPSFFTTSVLHHKKTVMGDSVKGLMLECASAISCIRRPVIGLFLLEITDFGRVSHSATSLSVQ